jgi:hypothetical protein
VATAFAIARPRSTVGIVGVPHGVDVPFPELLPDVLEGRIDPGRVFD